MTPERNQPDSNQTGQRNSEQADTQSTSQSYRPDWIIPDNGSSSRAGTSSESKTNQKNDRQSNSRIPLDNEDTLGIP